MISLVGMPRLPVPQAIGSPRCDPRLAAEALRFRMKHSLVTPSYLSSINVTAWLYVDKKGVQGIKVNPNTTIAELDKQFGPAQTPDAEVGIHSEGKAAEWFRKHPEFKVLQIFSERIPCPIMCGPLIRNYFPGVPCYYYYDRRSWSGGSGRRVVKTVSEVLKTAYGL